MTKQNNKTIIPDNYDNYIFDLYGTLVDIHTDEKSMMVWQKLAVFYGYYGAIYKPIELKEAYENIVAVKEDRLKTDLMTRYSHEASPEIEITEVFSELFIIKKINPTKELAVYAGQFFRILSTKYVRAYPGTEKMLKRLKNAGKGIYLLSNAQRIFTEYEMNYLDISKYFDAIFISSDYQMKKPDRKFFELLTTKLFLDLNKSLFIGNDSTTDIKGAKNMGIDTFYVKSNISPENDIAIDSTYIVDEFKKWE